MAERSNNALCVSRTHVDAPHKTWCGQDDRGRTTFRDAAQAAESGLQGGPLVACPQCVDAIAAALRAGREWHR